MPSVVSKPPPAQGGASFSIYAPASCALLRVFSLCICIVKNTVTTTTLTTATTTTTKNNTNTTTTTTTPTNTNTTNANTNTIIYSSLSLSPSRSIYLYKWYKIWFVIDYIEPYFNFPFYLLLSLFRAHLYVSPVFVFSCSLEIYNAPMERVYLNQWRLHVVYWLIYAILGLKMLNVHLPGSDAIFISDTLFPSTCGR